VTKTAFFLVGPFVLLALVDAGAGPAGGAQGAAAKKSAPASSSGSSATPVKSTSATNSTVRPPASKATTTAGARARAAAAARALALPHYKVDENGDLVPDLRAAAAIIYDPETNEILWEEHSQDQRSIASLTKVMTAAVFLESDPDLTQPIVVSRSDVFHASTTRLRANDRITTDDLLHLLLIASDNAAARALARVSPYGSEGFVSRMNQKAVELGLENTSYAEPSGLLSNNLSSAYDMARLISIASSDERIGSIMRTPEYTIRTANRRLITVHTTNRLLGLPDVDVRAGKTGFISSSGYCLATLLRLPQGGQEVAVVVLGAQSNAGRFMETRNLFTWMSAKLSSVFGGEPPPAPQSLQ
jgi:D-alanyl-D-alanine endopeptidase (penicillin-binding protein 7)